MKISKYLRDKWLSMIVFIFSYFIILSMFVAFRIPVELMIAVTIVYFLTGICIVVINLFRKKKFYDEFIYNTNAIDKKYLVLETMEQPNFYEGELLYQNLYEINKSMVEHISDYRENMNDFKEYIEMWIHEAKIPIASLTLMLHNYRADKKNSPMLCQIGKGENSLQDEGVRRKNDEKYSRQIRRLDNYIDQVLYYMRSNYTENDYLIKETRLDKLVGSILIKNKDDLLENNISVSVDTKNLSVMTDAKWLEFILNQIINNSMKYKRENIDAVIKIDAKESSGSTTFQIYDNGMGIPKKDLPNVFKKSFTGENGRKGTKSTGMGLYIAKKLCVKLGHKIEIESEENQWTRVTITFGKNDYYKM